MFYQDVLAALNRKRVDYLVVGGIAMALHGAVRLTADLDLSVDLSERNLRKLLDVMAGLGYKPRVSVRAEDLLDPARRQRWIEEKNMEVFSFYHPKEAGLVDVFIREPVAFADLKRGAVKVKAGRLSVPVVALDDLIRLKDIAGRTQDMSDIVALERLRKNARR